MTAKSAAPLSPRTEDAGKLLLRLTVGGLLLLHGLAKLGSGVDWMAGPLAAVGLPAFVAYGAYLGEVVGPLLLLAGLWTRIGAVLVAGNMATAILLVLRARIFELKPQGGGLAIELELLFLLGSVAILLLGPGRFSVDRRRG